MPEDFRSLFSQKPAILGMVHVAALPGTPSYRGDPAAIVDMALEEASVYEEAGLDGIVLENMHDLPYLKREVGPEIVAFMSVVAKEVKRQSHLPVGIQILAGANKAALGVALAAGLDFIRAEGFVYGHLADEGLMQSDAGELLRYRRQIGAEGVLILTDIQKKHSSHAITSDLDIVEIAKAAAFFQSDGLILTGAHTGEAASVEQLQKVRESTELALLVGSGIRQDNLAEFIPHADGLIVGSWFKRKGLWSEPVDPDRVRAFVQEARRM